MSNYLRLAMLSAVLLIVQSVRASEIADVLPLTDRVVMLHFNDGYVIHHKDGQPRVDEKVVVNPLDTAAASRAASYQIVSADDPAYAAARQPADVGRKSKGMDFSWNAKWENGRAVSTPNDHDEQHWLYLFLPEPMKRGSTYTVRTGALGRRSSSAGCDCAAPGRRSWRGGTASTGSSHQPSRSGVQGRATGGAADRRRPSRTPRRAARPRRPRASRTRAGQPWLGKRPR